MVRIWPELIPGLDGINVFKANDIIVNMLRDSGALLHVEKLQHSYPCCWRHKSPIIFRATPQWFVSMDQKGLRAQSLKEIKGVQWIPGLGPRVSNPWSLTALTGVFRVSVHRGRADVAVCS